MPNTRENPNCQDCPYRRHLARAFDIHIWKEDCDKFSTEKCFMLKGKIDNGHKRNAD